MRRATRYLDRFGLPPKYLQIKLSPDELAAIVESAGFEVDAVQLAKSWLYLHGTKK